MSAQIESSIDPHAHASGESDVDQQTIFDRLVIFVSSVTGWLFPILMLAITAQVVMRKLGHNQAWLDDAQWWMYGFSMTVGFSYAITTQSHVRVDILHQNFSAPKKAKIEVFGLGWLLLPFLIIMADVLFHYGWASFVAGEGSSSANGLHKLYLLKLSLPALFVLAILASMSMMRRHLMVFASARLWTFLLGMFPAAWFMAERASFYILWWAIRATNSEIEVRRISNEPIIAHTIWYGLIIVLVAIIVSFGLSRRASKG
ncbi:TRAP transporter small permease subunit [Planktotalea sp.]|uniref:TRAP transporter small permease subunit n=1 Tax=Planktotalea sp. TaxID=2029877 RepID=UPI0032979F55